MTIDEPITVGSVDGNPRYIIWKGRNYTITKIGLHHHFRQGATLYHVFSVVTDTLFFRLRLNTESLLWRLEGIENGI